MQVTIVALAYWNRGSISEEEPFMIKSNGIIGGLKKLRE